MMKSFIEEPLTWETSQVKFISGTRYLFCLFANKTVNGFQGLTWYQLHTRKAFFGF